jgi:hypothetical protein
MVHAPLSRLWLCWLACLSLCGCVRFDRRAPGVIDVARPPEVPSLRAVEAARWSGEDLFVLTPAVLGLCGPCGRVWRGSLAAELSLEWGWFAHNDHVIRAPLLLRWRTPERAWGLAAGAQLLFDRPNDSSAPVVLSLELRRRWSLLVFGAGPLYEPGAQRLGVQGSFFAPPLVFRFGYVRSEGLVGYLGLQLFFPVTWVRTR